MKRLLAKLYTSSLCEMLRSLKARYHRLRSRYRHDDPGRAVADELRARFRVYQTCNLQSVPKEEFSRHLQSAIGVVDGRSEGYCDEELEQQRDLTLKFHWGHNHDFGDFRLEGRMRDRHIDVLANFITLFPIGVDDFKGKSVFDIGCWTGGTTLLLATLANRVLAIEEVRKYADMASYLAKAFGLDDRVSVKPTSIYDCVPEEFHDRFNIVFCPGVIYHLSDPVLALRILFNSLKEGGIILIESAGINHPRPVCRFEGSRVYGFGTKNELNRSGWNWFVPSPSALDRMMREAGFDHTQTVWHYGTSRVYGYGKKTSQVGVCKAGLSVPTIK